MKVNAAGTDKIDGTLSSVSYSGSVVAANPAATSGSSRTIGFMATANGWVSGVSVNWLSTSIQSTILTDRYASGFQTNKSELLPIPLVSLNANFNLTQNPKY